MQRFIFRVSGAIPLFSIAILMLALAGCGGGSGATTTNKSSSGSGGGNATPPAPPATLQTAVQHIILLMQENRSFDEYFGHLNDYRASKGLSTEVEDLTKIPPVTLPNWQGGTTSAFHATSACSWDLSSSWVEAHIDMNLHNASNPGNPPPMNGFAYTAGGFSAHDPAAGGGDTAGKRAMGYYTADDLPFYYWAATTFATGDHFFSAAPARTQINRMYFLAATSNGYAFPGGSDGHPELNMDGVKNIFSLVDAANVSWKVYVTDGFVGGKSTGNTYMNYFSGFTQSHLDHFVDAATFVTDAQKDTLPAVSLIETGYTETGSDEHPLNPIDKGAKYVESLVQALMNSPAWKSSVLLITYDEGGGFYDHVPPMQTVSPDGKGPYLIAGDPAGDFTVTGFRVPLMVISPFAKPGYVSHTPADFTAFLKFIEERFNLPNLNKRDAAQPSMDEYFDWSGPNMKSTNPPAQPSLPCNRDRFP